MSEKTQFLQAVAAELQHRKACFAKMRALVRTSKNGDIIDRAQLEILQANLRAIQSSLSDLASARHDEWSGVRERLESQLNAVKLPAPFGSGSYVDVARTVHEDHSR
jgi:hypothetical protein